MNCTVSGGTSPTAVILWPSITVENAEEEPAAAECGTAGWSACPGCTSTNTDTEANPSVNTMWSTRFAEPGRIWAERVVILNPGGRRIAFQANAPGAGRPVPPPLA